MQKQQQLHLAHSGKSIPNGLPGLPIAGVRPPPGVVNGPTQPPPPPPVTTKPIEIDIDEQVVHAVSFARCIDLSSPGKNDPALTLSLYSSYWN